MMNKQPSLTITIPAPCQESWDKMNPVEDNRFCVNCQKSIVDFSNMSDQQIITFFNTTNGNICGRFHSEQLGRELTPSNINKQRRQPFAFIAATTAALTLIMPSAKAQHSTAKVQVVSDGTTPVPVPQQRDTTTPVTGVVIDSMSNSPLKDVNVIMKGLSYIANTDSTGRFYLPDIFKKQDIIVLTVSCAGYERQQITINRNIDSTKILLKPLEQPTLILGGAQAVITVTDIQRPTAWERIKHSILDFF